MHSQSAPYLLGEALLPRSTCCPEKGSLGRRDTNPNLSLPGRPSTCTEVRALAPAGAAKQATWLATRRCLPSSVTSRSWGDAARSPVFRHCKTRSICGKPVASPGRPARSRPALEARCSRVLGPAPESPAGLRRRFPQSRLQQTSLVSPRGVRARARGWREKGKSLAAGGRGLQLSRAQAVPSAPPCATDLRRGAPRNCPAGAAGRGSRRRRKGDAGTHSAAAARAHRTLAAARPRRARPGRVWPRARLRLRPRHLPARGSPLPQPRPTTPRAGFALSASVRGSFHSPTTCTLGRNWSRRPQAAPGEVSFPARPGPSADSLLAVLGAWLDCSHFVSGLARCRCCAWLPALDRGSVGGGGLHDDALPAGTHQLASQNFHTEAAATLGAHLTPSPFPIPGGFWLSLAAAKREIAHLPRARRSQTCSSPLGICRGDRESRLWFWCWFWSRTENRCGMVPAQMQQPHRSAFPRRLHITGRGQCD